MPRGDGTGPMGIGATGRGLGYCNTTNIFNNVNRMGLGRRCGFGVGNGFGSNIASTNTVSPISEELLSQQKEILEKRLEIINKQLGNK